MFIRRKKLDIDALVEEYRSQTNAILLDVRTPQEYRQGHIPHSVLVPLDTIADYAADPHKEYYVYCRSGARSSRAVKQLNKRGYHAKNIGGIVDYHGKISK